MAYSRTHSVCLVGVDGYPVTIEVHIGQGPSCLVLTGMPDTALKQSTVRIRSAFENSRLTWPDSYTAVNLLPASLPKTGSGCDLAIAAGLLSATGQVPADGLDGTVVLGELGLDGRLRPVRGVLPALLASRRCGTTRAIVPSANLAEAGLVSAMDCRGATTLSGVVAHLRGETTLPRAVPGPAEDPQVALPDMADIVGQESARRAMEIAAAGGHHMFMLGPPGTGKTMLAERLPSILPPLSETAALETTALHSIADLLGGGPPSLLRRPPFSAPHHSATMPAMVGGGSFPLHPGAVSIAHNGVLFLDECPEFKREVLDALRQPLESGEIFISRARTSARFPARVQLILAANPCPCAATTPATCGCPPAARRRYLARLSGPLLDRVDIRLEISPIPMSALLAETETSEPSEPIAARVAAARAAAVERWRSSGHPWRHNSEVPGPQLRAKAWRLPSATTATADWLVDSGRLTGRGYDRVLRLAWSICDLAGRRQPDAGDINEATGLRIGHQLSALPIPQGEPHVPRRRPRCTHRFVHFVRTRQRRTRRTPA